jgi:hypothetical protein
MLAAAGLVLPFVHVTKRVRAPVLPGNETPAV